MQLPFTTEQFLEVFTKYNTGMFPVQIIFYLAAILMIFYVIIGNEKSSKKILFILTFMWLWIGIVYHIIYFSEINKAAYLFGLLFIIQGSLFLYHLRKGSVLFSNKNDVYSLIGWIIIAYGLLVYPIFGYLSGHIYPGAPVLGAPCPTAIFTFGIFLFSNKLPKTLLIIPVIWAFLSFAAAYRLNIFEDYGLFLGAIISTSRLLSRDYKMLRCS